MISEEKLTRFSTTRHCRGSRVYHNVESQLRKIGKFTDKAHKAARDEIMSHFDWNQVWRSTIGNSRISARIERQYCLCFSNNQPINVVPWFPALRIGFRSLPNQHTTVNQLCFKEHTKCSWTQGVAILKAVNFIYSFDPVCERTGSTNLRYATKSKVDVIILVRNCVFKQIRCQSSIICTVKRDELRSIFMHVFRIKLFPKHEPCEYGVLTLTERQLDKYLCFPCPWLRPMPMPMPMLRNAMKL